MFVFCNSSCLCCYLSNEKDKRKSWYKKFLYSVNVKYENVLRPLVTVWFFKKPFQYCLLVCFISIINERKHEIVAYESFYAFQSF